MRQASQSSQPRPPCLQSHVQSSSFPCVFQMGSSTQPQPSTYPPLPQPSQLRDPGTLLGPWKQRLLGHVDSRPRVSEGEIWTSGLYHFAHHHQCAPPASISDIFTFRGVSLLVPDIISFWPSGRHTFQKTRDKPILSYTSFFTKKKLLPEAQE